MRLAAARGQLRSGATEKALTRYASDYATTKYENYLNRLQSLAGQGLTGAGGLGQIGYGTGRGIAQNYLTGGMGQAAGYINMANVLTGGLRSAMQDWMFYNYLKGAGGPPYAAQAKMPTYAT